LSFAYFLWLMASTALVLPFLDPRAFRKRWLVRATGIRIVLAVLELATIAGWFLVRGRWRLLPDQDEPLALAGALLALTGALLAAWTKRTLGGLFSPHLGVQEQHRLITTGPFAIVRHPMYLGIIEYIAGSALFFHDLALLGVAALFVLFFSIQLRQEERLFRAHFGDEWEAYRARTPALLPRLLPGRRRR
jgi:protein-S-isoprenylcysteine O-methyltransferase Ste14